MHNKFYLDSGFCAVLIAFRLHVPSPINNNESHRIGISMLDIQFYSLIMIFFFPSRRLERSPKLHFWFVTRSNRLI